MTSNAESTPLSGWRRLLAEGVVIVLSILLAFGIEASWTASRDRARIASQLASVQAEIGANATAVSAALERTQLGLRALQTIVDLIGPSGGAISPDSLSSLFVAGFNGMGSAELEVGALAQLLSAGDLQATVQPELYAALVSFRTTAQRYTENQDLFRQNRESAISYLVGVAPTAFISAGTGAHAPTDFPIPVESLLRDPQLEGLVGNLAVRVANIERRADTLVQLADTIDELLDRGAAS